MNNKERIIGKKTAAIFIVGLFSFVILSFSASSARAATSTVEGTAWWGEDYREVYFNCQDAVFGDHLDVAGNLGGSGRSAPYDKFLFHSLMDPCDDLSFGVEISSNGNFSGKAWNWRLGFISFSGSATPPDGGASTASPTYCQSTCTAGIGCWACYNESNQNIYGWARVDGTGEWLRLDSGLTPSVRLKNCITGSFWPGSIINPGDFIGYASSTYGNLSFNCESETGGSVCGTRNYKVNIGNLTAGHLSAPNWSYTDACSGTARGAVLGWCRQSGTQGAYEIAISEGSTLNTSTALCWSKTSSTASQYTIPGAGCTLDYNKNYYWWLRLYDQYGVPTDWYQYDSNSSADTDGDSDNNSRTFTTYKHEFPTPYAIWSPYQIFVGTSTFFTASSSQYATIATPSTYYPCSSGYCRYLWTTSDSGAIISSTTAVAPTIIFNLATNTTITLRVTDNENYYCSYTTSSKINYDLPIWREIKAK